MPKYKLKPEVKRLVIPLVTYIILFSLFITLIVRPGITGYTTYVKMKKSNFTVDSYEENLNNLQTTLKESVSNYTECTVYNEKLFDELRGFNQNYTVCLTELNGLKLNHSMTVLNYEEEVQFLRQAIADEQDKAEEYQEESLEIEGDYWDLAKNVANNLCCKAKVENNRISHYKVENNMIICLEEGSLKLEC